MITLKRLTKNVFTWFYEEGDVNVSKKNSKNKNKDKNKNNKKKTMMCMV